eukprot:g38369.t1
MEFIATEICVGLTKEVQRCCLLLLECLGPKGKTSGIWYWSRDYSGSLLPPLEQLGLETLPPDPEVTPKTPAFQYKQTQSIQPYFIAEILHTRQPP